jgi:hypothetical protein
MNYYFMALIDGLEGVVTLANFPPKDGQVPWPPDQIAHVLWSEGDSWQFRPVKTVKPGKVESFKSSELPSEIPDQVSPFFCLSPIELPKQSTELPVNQFMGTTPAWRANIQLVSPYTSTSYQGEIPQGMLSIANGTVLSMSGLFQTGPGISNKFFIPNIHHNPEIKDCTVTFMGMRSHKIFHSATVQRNNCTIVDLDGIDSDKSDPIVVLSTDTTGIPVFLSHDAEFKYMSFEHTHPPTEMILFGNRPAHQKNMKKWWFDKMLEN